MVRFSTITLVRLQIVVSTWGINGIFSVLAPILAVAVSLSWGIGALLLAALPIYLVVGLVAAEPAH